MSEQLQLLADTWVGVFLSLAGALLAGVLVQWLIARLLLRVTHESTLVGAVARRVRRPFNLLVPLIALQFALEAAHDDVAMIGAVRHLNSLAIILSVTWVAISAVSAIASTLERLHPSRSIDNDFDARRIQTQSRVLGRTLTFTVGVIGFSIALMTFPTVRNIGTSLLASAGIAGIALGFAAKSVLGNLMAGVQLALTQPLRLDDVLIVNGEYGRVEEISSTYVVMHLWDDRRQIVPLQWFIENPFENWTRNSSDLLGTVFFWVGFGMPIDPLRTELRRLCEAAPEWDQRVCGLQVTDSTDHAVQLRALVSAVNSGKAFDLRCRIREGLFAYIQAHFPEHFPSQLTELKAAPPVFAQAFGDSVRAATKARS